MVILVALDESSFAKAALEKALELASPGKAEVVALSVIPHLGVVEGVQDKLIARFEREAKSLMDEAKAVAARHGVSLKTRVESGISPADTILDVAKEVRADLIVVGHRGKSNLEKFLIGSVASALVTYSPCSVLVVK
ncbi:MAG: universal stress protein [Pseudodesulfovibrio sp.]|uniref:UspA domain-containing protein n=1 Tax=Pseudodesulfovibrio aespoeensis (strain ATCC 700646 / DSM 10631 / Aspo-2) TaxID=643562 RepID=E6VUK3_PSEA9|nr:MULTISPECIES: universal stress protein [Pseudodesulfovibrio]MBU4191037.1 universal stress protein [Pseudomonadota bacterium]ADU61148.1 UspA domain-containing protein [Pseudodesulfovibrio aespoeensis Aspo-2]MBU4244384.1 universal stress protein [Pseudomonadota bacterium]MBU4378760.1 universal stress protein [Pseudomonadota bacterium]MBU4475791.1 universal stress protein [Pseudomonadota bacterium]